jgi:hypothetical protein|tara:strand:- start:172 stop:348 length:177 start_codon:yes stop_codon:yes gene_type:complete
MKDEPRSSRRGGGEDMSEEYANWRYRGGPISSAAVLAAEVREHLADCEVVGCEHDAHG